ncbi:MAG: hypothetical protein ACODAD_12065 [Planctomycetota bacterium]
MNGAYAVLAVRIRQELGDLKRVSERTARALRQAAAGGQQQDLFLDATALNLHDFYCGVERICQRIAETMDGSVPAGRDWHRELLRQMAADLAPIRPQALSRETVKLLDEYMRFRHVVRNVYAFEFELARIQDLVRGLAPCLERVESELMAFVDFLNEVADEA